MNFYVCISVRDLFVLRSPFENSLLAFRIGLK